MNQIDKFIKESNVSTEGLNEEYQNIILAIHKKEFTETDKDKHELKLKEMVQYGYLKEEKRTYLISNWFFSEWLKSTG